MEIPNVACILNVGEKEGKNPASSFHNLHESNTCAKDSCCQRTNPQTNFDSAVSCCHIVPYAAAVFVRQFCQKMGLRDPRSVAWILCIFILAVDLVMLLLNANFVEKSTSRKIEVIARRSGGGGASAFGEDSSQVRQLCSTQKRN